MYQSTRFSSNKLKSAHMKALHLLILLPLSILCLKSTAQVDDLMRNKDITWIAESYNDFLTDARAEEKIGKELSRVIPLKVLNHTEGYDSEEFALQYELLKAVKKKEIVIYEDPNCKTIMQPKNLLKIDSITLCDPNIWEAQYRIRESPYNEEDVIFFRAHQVMFYDAKRVQFGLRTIALAPMVKVYNSKYIQFEWKPLFWMKVTDLTKKRNLSNDGITWAKRMSLHYGVALKADSVKILKQMSDSVPIAPLFQAFLTKPNIPFYRSDSMPLWVKHTPTEKQKLFIQRDTITCIALEPAFVIINRDIHHFDVVGLRLIQNWYWDDKKKRLEIYLVSTAPLKDVKKPSR
jgi:Gliding motility associated protein GldN